MKRLLLPVIVCALGWFTLGADKPAPSQPARPASDAKSAVDDALVQQGVWKPIGAIMSGARLPAESLKAITLTITGSNYVVSVEGEPQPDKGSCALDQTTKPKRMVLVSTEGPNQGKTFLAIYEMKDTNSLRVCYDLSGTDFPKDFKAPKGTQNYLVGYRRQAVGGRR